MALADRLPIDNSKPCRFARIYELMKPEDQETLHEWISNKVPQRTIIAAIKAEYPEDGSMSDGTLANHCYGRCSCSADMPLRKVWS